MESVPDGEEREAILDGFSDLIREVGAGDFLHGPTLLPTPEYFPDEWRPDADGAMAMLGRLLAWARLGDFGFAFDELWTSDQGFGMERREFSGAAACYMGEREGGILSFGLDATKIEDAERLAGVLAHEVAHAWRHEHGLMVEDREQEECLTDLTSVFLGMGLLTTNNTLRFRSWSDARTATWSSEQLGYLSPRAMSFALAVALRARNKPAEIEPVLEALERSQKPLVRAALQLLPPSDQLRLRLGIPLVVPLPPPIELPAAERLLEAQKERPTQYSLRWARNRAALAGLIGFIAGSLLALLTLSWWPLLLVIPFAALGTRWTYDICLTDDCACPLRPDQTECGACGALLVGRFNKGHRLIEPRFLSFVAEVDAANRELQAERDKDDEELEKEALRG